MEQASHKVWATKRKRPRGGRGELPPIPSPYSPSYAKYLRRHQREQAVRIRKAREEAEQPEERAQTDYLAERRDVRSRKEQRRRLAEQVRAEADGLSRTQSAPQAFGRCSDESTNAGVAESKVGVLDEDAKDNDSGLLGLSLLTESSSGRASTPPEALDTTGVGTQLPGIGGSGGDDGGGGEALSSAVSVSSMGSRSVGSRSISWVDDAAGRGAEHEHKQTSATYATAAAPGSARGAMMGLQDSTNSIRLSRQQSAGSSPSRSKASPTLARSGSAQSTKSGSGSPSKSKMSSPGRSNGIPVPAQQSFQYDWRPKRSDPLYQQFAFHMDQIRFPVGMLFTDTMQTQTIRELSLAAWNIHDNDLWNLGVYVTSLDKLVLDDNSELTSVGIENLRNRVSGLKHVSVARCTSLDDETLAVLKSCYHKSLTHLNMTGCRFFEDALRALLASCTELQVLIAEHSPAVTESSLRAIKDTIKRNRNLRSVNVSGCKVFTEESMLSLLSGQLASLSALNLVNCSHLTDLSFMGLRREAVGSTTDLLELRLDGLAKITDLALICISEGCKRLQRLSLRRCPQVADLGLEHIGLHCADLRELYLEACTQVSDDGVAALFARNGKRMEVLDLTACTPLTDASLRAAAKNVFRLRGLVFNGLSNLTDDGMRPLLRKSFKLKSFVLGASLGSLDGGRKSGVPHIGDGTLLALGQHCTFLERLILPGATRITDAGLCALFERCPHLEEVNIRNCYNVSDDSLVMAAKHCPKLKFVCVSGCLGVTDRAISSLVRKCPKLSSLECFACRGVTDRSMQALARHGRRLQAVNLQGCDRISDTGLAEMFRACGNLSSVNVSGLDQVSMEAATALATYCPAVRRADFSLCALTDRVLEHLCRSYFPFARKAKGKLMLVPRQPSVIQYNKFVYGMRRRVTAVRAIEKVMHRYIVVMAEILRMKTLNIRATQIQATIRGALERERHKERIAALTADDRASRLIQKWYRYQYMMRFANATRRYHIRRKRAATAVQRWVRGHRARKRFPRKLNRFRGACVAWKKFFILAQIHFPLKSLALKGAKFQAHFRRRREQRSYWIAYDAIIKLQSGVRMHKARVVRFFRQKDRYHVMHIKRREAAFTIQDWFRRRMNEWRAMQSIDKCVALYRIECRTQHRAANLLQEVWLDYVVARNEWLDWMRQESAKKIQGAFRSFMARNFLRQIKRHKVRIHQRWVYLVKRRFHRWLDANARIIQAWWMGFVLLERQAMAGYVLTRLARGFLGRCLVRHMLEAERVAGAVSIQRAWRVKAGRLYLAHLRESRIQAAFRIQLAYKEYCMYWRRRQHVQLAARSQREAMEREKVALALKRRERILAKLRNDAHSMYAGRIQRTWREHYRKKKRREEAERQRRKMLEDARREAAEEEAMQKKAREDRMIHKRLQNAAGVVATSALATAGNVARAFPLLMDKPSEEDSKAAEEEAKAKAESEAERAEAEAKAKAAAAARKRRKRAQRKKQIKRALEQLVAGEEEEKHTAESQPQAAYSVVFRQTMSIRQDGFIAMSLTAGEAAKHAFSEVQRHNKSMHNPHFELIDHDISGESHMNIYLWVLRGSGNRVITQIKCRKKPLGASERVMKQRVQQFRSRGYQLVYHENVPFEIHAFASMSMHISGAAIDSIMFAHSEEEAQELEQSGYRKAQNLSNFGIGQTEMWVHSLAPPKPDEGAGAPGGTDALRQFSWYDDRLERMIEVYALTAEEVQGLFAQFRALDLQNNGTVIQVDDWMESLHQERVTYCDYMLVMVGTANRNTVTFSEYVNIICYMCMFDKKEMHRYIFGMIDQSGKGMLLENEFERLIDVVLEAEPTKLSVAQYKHAFRSLCNPKKELVYDRFAVLVSRFPRLCHALFRLQEELQIQNLGKPMWEAKKRLFQGVRKHMGVNLS